MWRPDLLDFHEMCIIVVYISLYSKCGFHESWHSDRLIFLKGVHESLHALPTFHD
jgi:hypothetical protein